MSLFHKTEAVAVVRAVSLVERLKNQHGSPTAGARLHYTLEVRPPEGAPFTVEQNVDDWDPSWADYAPKVGDEVPVSFHGRNPDEVSMHLKGDPRFDRYAADALQREQDAARFGQS